MNQLTIPQQNQSSVLIAYKISKSIWIINRYISIILRNALKSISKVYILSNEFTW
jgi:hypothetical protein